MYTITLPGKPHLYNPVTPPGWEVVGEILRDGEYIPGALIRHEVTGNYAQANAGGVRSLDPRGVALALAATVPEVDLDGEQELTAAQAAELVGQTPQTIKYWRSKGYLEPIAGSRPARYRKVDILTAKDRKIKSGRPKKTA